jgi:hypothetical protein
MAELTSKEPSPDCMFGIKAGSKSCKSDLTPGFAGGSPLNPPQQLIFVRYLDHVLYSRASALAMKPQTREAVGWLVYDCELYLTLTWDRDADPPTLKGGDPKASGLVILKSDIVRWEKFYPEPLPKKLELNLKSKHAIQEPEYAFRPSERKTHSSKGRRTL